MNQEKEFTDLLMQHQHIIYKICLMYASRTEAASVHGSTGLP